jgi:toxin-antitoxin system PIN domain toxin
VIAVDTNILVYAHRRDHEWHEPAKTRIAGLAQDRARWCVPWPCIHEFFAVVTRPGIFNPPSTGTQAFAQIEAWREAPAFELIGESAVHLATLARLVGSAKLKGGAIHDARIAAICLDHRASELWTADRDFSRFPALKTRNPLLAAQR